MPIQHPEFSYDDTDIPEGITGAIEAIDEMNPFAAAITNREEEMFGNTDNGDVVVDDPNDLPPDALAAYNKKFRAS